MSIASHAIFWTVAFVVFVALVIMFKSVLFPFVLGALLAYLLNPTVNWLSRKNMKRQTAVLLILGTFIVFFSALLAIVVPILLREAAGFIKDAPSYGERVWAMVQPMIAMLQEKIGYNFTGQITEQIQTAVQDNIGQTLGVGKNMATGLISSIAIGGQAIAGFIAILFLTPIVAFFMMNDWPRITAWVSGLIPRHSEQTVHGLLSQIDVKIAGFIRGQLTVCFILGMMYGVALTVAGLNYGFFIGLATGVLCIIPYAGTALGFGIGLVVAFLQTDGDLTYIGIIAAIFAVGQFIEGNFITPKLIGDKVGLHPLWIIFALLAGGSLSGLVGMLLAVPVAAIISVLVSFAISKYKMSQYYQTEPPPPDVHLHYPGDISQKS
jgi:predicted PurR-regulated permease PerM